MQERKDLGWVNRWEREGEDCGLVWEEKRGDEELNGVVWLSS